MKQVLEFIKKLNIKNKNIVIALSGGPDSMMLLKILLDLREELNVNIIAAHVHHNLRKESDDEAVFVEEYCRNNNVIFEMMKIEKYPNNKFSEESARKIRYDFFGKILNKYDSDILFTAHHGDDLIETVLMRLTRGSNLKGYAGFESISTDKGYKIAKPLIYLQKSQIKEYLDKNNIKYVIDMSNESDNYTRNRYRNYILPKLKEENSLVHEKFIKYSEKILMASKYIEKEVLKVKDDMIVNNEILIDKFIVLDDIIKINLLELYLKDIYKDNICLITDKHINIILNNIREVNIDLDMPLNKKIKIEYNKLKFIEKNEYIEYDYIFDNNIKLPNGDEIKELNESDITTNYVTYLDSSEIKLPLHVRNRRENDKMIVKNMNSHKKINDIFTDEKIPSSKRDMYPIVTDDNGVILWLPGIKKSHLDKTKGKKYDIILKYN